MQIKNFFEDLVKSFTIDNLKVKYKVLINNKMILVFMFFNFLFFFANTYVSVISFIILFILYILLVNICFSDFLEKILRKKEDIRHVATLEEKKRLNNIFDSVYSTVKEKLLISNNIKLFILDDINITAFSLMRNTVVLSRGLINTMDDEELKAIIAHELAHIYYGDTQLQILFKGLTFLYAWALYIISYGLELLAGFMNDSALKEIVLTFKTLADKAINVIISLLTIVFARQERRKEYRADEFAFNMGYGISMLNVLYKVYDMEIKDKKSLLMRYQNSHPRTAFRIERLEKL